MNVVIFGATGMLGQSALRECLLDPGVERVLTIGRKTTGQLHDKLRELVLADLTNYSGVAADLAGYDACFFCLGVSSAGMSEADYRRVTVDIAVAAGRARRGEPGDDVHLRVGYGDRQHRDQPHHVGAREGRG